MVKELGKVINNKWFVLSVQLIYFALIFYFSIVPLRDFDIWFHVKSGEIIASQGIIHHDVFSYRTAGREWFPYEWLFQIGVYGIQQIAGFEFIKYAVAALALTQIALVYAILRRCFNLAWLSAIILSFAFFASVFEFTAARPQILAYSFLLANLFLILLYYFKNKNYLFLTIPITILWANMHGSIFLDVAFFAGYATMSFANFRLLHDKAWLVKAKTLGIWFVATIFLTILPPLYFTQYRLLVYFYQQRDFINKFIDEWTPLILSPIPFAVYSSLVVIIVSLFLVFNIRNKTLKNSLWVIPLIPFIFTPFFAIRNIFLAYIPLVLMLSWVASQIRFEKFSAYLKIGFLILTCAFIYINALQLSLKKNELRMYFPAKAVEFMKTHKINGNMFNEYGYGGYLLYHLYPQYKVLYDGRTDLYLCCEMPQTLELAHKKYLPNDEYKKLLYKTLDKYKISFVLLRTEKNTVIRRITSTLTNDPNWSLVYWDDASQILVRKDGKNNALIESLGTKAATPYERNPYREPLEDEALVEYEKMLRISDSAKTRNSIGFILLQKGRFDEAKSMFIAATHLNPNDESPFMNLAELAARDKDYTQAISLYEHAQQLAPDRGLIYIRLGQLYLLAEDDITKAKMIWGTGLKNTIDSSAKKRLQELLSR